MAGERCKRLYKKGWILEGYYESITQNASIGSSPAPTIKRQSHQIFTSI
jgi:hypothetical protein